MEPQSRDAIAQALNDFHARIPIYRLMSDYYHGRHRFGFATEKYVNIFRRIFGDFRLNLCPAVVDAVTDRLVVTGFTLEDAGDADPDAGPDPDSPEDRMDDVWKKNRMDQRAGELHNEAVMCGDAYAVVWENEEDPAGPPQIFVNTAMNMTVHYDPDHAGRKLWAAKQWASGGRVRLNLYFADRIERYVTKAAPLAVDKGLPPLPTTADAFVPYTGPNQDGSEEPTLPNPYGQVPVFHFANNGRIGGFGKSELWDAVPLQDALNKTVIDQLVGAEFMALPQRYVTGIEIAYDEETGDAKPPSVNPGADRVWSLPSDATAGQFPAADLGGLDTMIEKLQLSMVRVTATPMHYIVQTAAPPSGEALQTMEYRFVKKVKDRQVAFGNVWEDVAAFAAQIAGIGTDVRFQAEWEDPAPKSELEHMQALSVKKVLGVPDPTLWKEMGYTAEDIEDMNEQKQASLASMGQAMMRQFDSGAPAGQGAADGQQPAGGDQTPPPFGRG